MRILMLIHRLPDASPYCFFVHEQAKALVARGHEVVVFSPVMRAPLTGMTRPEIRRMDETTPREAEVDGVKVYYPRALSLGEQGQRLLGGTSMARAILPLAKRLHREKPFDIVHAHMLPREGHAGLMLGRSLGVPVALTVHGTDVLRYFLPGVQPARRNAAIAREVDALMAVSGMLLCRVAPYRPEGILRVVPNGVDLSLIPERTANRPRQVISVGTLKQRKCMDRTLEAFARVAGDWPDATLTIVGVGEMEEELKRRIEALGLQARARLTGGLPHAEVLRRMAESDLFVLPSWGEGYGVVYIEAMAAGCIAVGAQGEGIEDTLRDGKNGFLVPAGDVEAVEAVMRRVFADPGGYAALREQGRWDARTLTWARNAETVEAVYEEAIAAFRERNRGTGV